MISETKLSAYSALTSVNLKIFNRHQGEGRQNKLIGRMTMTK